MFIINLKRKIVIKNSLLLIDKIPNSVKIGILGEFLGRIGMGIMSTYLIFYLIQLTGSLTDYPIFLTLFLLSTLIGSTFSGYIGNKYEITGLLRKISLVGIIFIILIPFTVNSVFGLLILYFVFGILFSTFIPLLSTHIINETTSETRDLSYSFYKGASIVGQNLSGFVGGFLLILLFFNNVTIESMKFLLIIGFALIGTQIILLKFVNTKQISDSDNFANNDVNSTIEKENLMLTSNNVPQYRKYTSILMLLALIFSSFGIGGTFSYLALFITSLYKIQLGDISIILALIGLITGLTTFSASYFTKKIKKNTLLGVSDIFYGLTSILIFVFPPFILLIVILFFRELISSIASPITNIILLTSVSQQSRNLFASIAILLALFFELFGSIISVLLINATGIFYNFILCGIAFIVSGFITTFMIKELKS
ncbi:MAG: MFS transporter [Candidatus Thorarchaeota archaeon]